LKGGPHDQLSLMLGGRDNKKLAKPLEKGGEKASTVSRTEGKALPTQRRIADRARSLTQRAFFPDNMTKMVENLWKKWCLGGLE